MGLSDRQFNADFAHKNNELAQASPSNINSRLTSRRSSPSAAGDDPNNPALASKFAYGQAQTRKQTEFETVVSPKAGFRDIAERKMSGESLGRGARLLNSSSKNSDFDENDPGVVKAHASPFQNMSNFSKSSAKPGLTAESYKQQEKTGRFVGCEELENHTGSVVTPRQNSVSAGSSNVVFSVKKSIEMEKRKRQIMASNKDCMQKHLDLLNRVQQQILR